MDFLDSRNFEFSIIKYVYIVALIGGVISLIFGKWTISLGLLVGATASSLNFLSLAWSVRRLVKLPKAQATTMATKGYVSRLLATCVVLGAAAYTKNLGFFVGTVAGYFLLKFVIVGLGILGKVDLNKDFDIY